MFLAKSRHKATLTQILGEIFFVFKYKLPSFANFEIFGKKRKTTSTYLVGIACCTFLSFFPLVYLWPNTTLFGKKKINDAQTHFGSCYASFGLVMDTCITGPKVSMGSIKMCLDTTGTIVNFIIHHRLNFIPNK
jgi:hypothetical protein